MIYCKKLAPKLLILNERTQKDIFWDRIYIAFKDLTHCIALETTVTIKLHCTYSFIFFRITVTVPAKSNKEFCLWNLSTNYFMY